MYQVLIADDERIIRNGLQVLVDWPALGFEVSAVAADGAQAFELAMQKRFDLILCDIRMPVLDGLSLTERLRKHGYGAEIVMVSGYRDFEYARRALSLGVSEYLLKPVDSGALQAYLQKLHGRLQQQAADSSPREEEIITTLGQMIAAHCCEPEFSLKRAAEQLSYSPVYLGRLFRQKTGKSFREQLNLCRMQKAAALLLEGTRCIYEVASLSGYRDVNYFYRVFREVYSVSPGEYKAARRRP